MMEDEFKSVMRLLDIASKELKEHNGEYSYVTDTRLIELLDSVLKGDSTAVGAIRYLEMNPDILNGRYV